MAILIDNFDAEELDIYARLTENQLLNRANPEEALFIAESPKVIMRALDAGCIPVSILNSFLPLFIALKKESHFSRFLILIATIIFYYIII